MARPLELRVRQNRIPEFLSKIPGLGFSSAEASARAIQQRARGLAPVLTGALRDSIAVEQERRTATAVAWLVYSPLDYSVYQEYGFHHWISGAFIPPQPYLTPAAALEVVPYQSRMIRAFGTLK